MVLLATLFLGASLSFIRDLLPGLARPALPVRVPDATFMKAEQLPFPYFKAYTAQGHEPAGYVFWAGDIMPDIKGYGGPIEIAMAVDARGTIKDITVASHHETSSYAGNLGDFVKQFLGRSVQDPLSVGTDVDAISGATVSSEAVTRIIRKSLAIFSREVIGVSQQHRPAPPPSAWPPVIIVHLLFTLAILGIWRRGRRLRWLAMAGGFVYFGLITHTMLSIIQVASAALMHIPEFLASPLWILTIIPPLLAALWLGRIYCGSLCPLALPFELLARAIPQRYRIPRPARSGAPFNFIFLKYILLITLVALAALLNSPSATNIEPFITLFTRHGAPPGWILLSGTLFIALFHYRFWCQYLCPVGALTGLISRISLFKISASASCSKCGTCQKACPVLAITASRQGPPVIDSAECILCGQCLDQCPEQCLGLKRTHPLTAQRSIGEPRAPAWPAPPGATPARKKLFFWFLAFYLIMIPLIMTDNLNGHERSGPSSGPVVLSPQETLKRSEALKKRFSDMGLPLHEGKYWQEVP